MYFFPERSSSATGLTKHVGLTNITSGVLAMEEYSVNLSQVMVDSVVHVEDVYQDNVLVVILVVKHRVINEETHVLYVSGYIAKVLNNKSKDSLILLKQYKVIENQIQAKCNSMIVNYSYKIEWRVYKS